MNYTCGQPVTIRFSDQHRDCADFAISFFEYIFPMLSVFVTTINVLIVIVFVKPHMRSHTTFILTLIACVEILNIACPAIVFAYQYLRGNYKQFLTSEQIRWSYILGKVCVDMFNMLSIWLTVLLAFIRCTCINSPYVARHTHSTKRITIYVIIILVFVVFVHVPSLYIFDFISVKHIDPIKNVTKEVGALVEAGGLFFKSCSGRKFHVFLGTLTDSVIPCVILVCCNIKILILLRKAKRSRTSLRRKPTVRCKINVGDNLDYLNLETEANIALNNEANKDTLQMEVFYDVERDVQETSKTCSGDLKYNLSILKNMKKGKDVKSSIFKCVKLHSFCTFQPREIRKNTFSDTTLDKLDKESERTSFLILLVLTIIIIHEFPLAIMNTYTLLNSADKPLPLSKGCFAVIILLWQFITYPAIFLIYACMCKAFRKELLKILTCLCRRHEHKNSKKKKPFPCPCSTQKRMQRGREIFARFVHNNALKRKGSPEESKVFCHRKSV